jgi:hypothetical protein
MSGPDCPYGVDGIPDEVRDGICSIDNVQCWNFKCKLGKWEINIDDMIELSERNKDEIERL